jgi:chitinase
MIPLSALPAFDRVEVMAYDNIVPGEEEASLTQFRSDLYLWRGRGVPKDKLVMGLPFYGHGYGSYNGT